MIKIEKIDTNDIEVTGNVVIKNIAYRLQTEVIHYHHKLRMIISEAPVEISGTSFNMTADSMSIDLNRHQAVFKGNIKGKLNEKTIL